MGAVMAGTHEVTGDVEAMMYSYGYVSEDAVGPGISSGESAFVTYWETDGSYFASLRNRCHAIASSGAFTGLFAALIVGNALNMGIAVDLENANAKSILASFEEFFLVAFCVEIIVRLLGSRVYPWRDKWLVMDTIIVIIGCIDEWALAGVKIDGEDLDFRVLLCMRLLRMARVVRFVRAVTYLRPIRILMEAIHHAANSLFWILVMLIGFFYLFAIVFRMLFQGVDANHELYDVVDTYFSSIGQFYITASAVLTRGFDWTNSITLPLLYDDTSQLAAGVWICFVVLTQFGCVNLIMGIFVENLLEVAEKSDEKFHKNHLVTNILNIEKLKAWFSDMDKQSCGYIDLQQFRHGLQKHAELRWVLSIEVGEADVCFQVLDMRGQGQVSLEDFLFGVLKLKGGSRSVDMLSIDYQIRQLLRSVHRAPKQAEELGKRLYDFERRLDGFSRELQQRQDVANQQMPTFLTRLQALESKVEKFMDHLRGSKADPAPVVNAYADGMCLSHILAEPRTPREATDVNYYVTEKGKVTKDAVPIPDAVVMEPWMLPSKGAESHQGTARMTLANIKESYHLQGEMKKLRDLLKAATHAVEGGKGLPFVAKKTSEASQSPADTRPMLFTMSGPKNADTPPSPGASYPLHSTSTEGEKRVGSWPSDGQATSPPSMSHTSSPPAQRGMSSKDDFAPQDVREPQHQAAPRAAEAPEPNAQSASSAANGFLLPIASLVPGIRR